MVLVVIPALAASGWVVTDTVMHRTSGESFCGDCHTMAPMVASYRQDIHGGAGARGVQARCAQCHLSHDNAISYLVSKTRFGMHDAWAQLTYDLDAIDWQAKREHRERFVFDSGCLECHANLESASESSAVNFVAHRPYFLGTTTSKCVTCHQRVGHKDLSAHLATASKGE